MCGRDMLFWINSFVYTHNPRIKYPKSPVVPFITYDFQDPMLHEIRLAIEIGYDILQEKSREMGASYCCLLPITWMYLYRDFNTFEVMSRVENLVDDPADPKSLFWKIDHILSLLPPWLKTNDFSRKHLNLQNKETGSTINGVTTTADSGVGGRRTAMLIDEFALNPHDRSVVTGTRDVTSCRIFNSTHRGTATAFYSLSQGKIKKIVTHWSLHPEKNKGLYFADKSGKLVLLDKNYKCDVFMSQSRETYKFPQEYPFRMDGKLRSPWYDNECDRAAHPMEIAQELDMDPFSSDFQFFDGKQIELIKNRDVRTPFLVGDLEFDERTLQPEEFTEQENGPLKLWIHPDAQGDMPLSLDAGIGIDISAGTGASNSAACVVNRMTGEKIAEYANPWIKPESFAKFIIALAKWFNEAYLIWDGGGPGRTFGDTVVSLGYRNIYYKRNEKSLRKKVSDIPGCFLNPEERKSVLGNYRKQLKHGPFIQRSHEANQECLRFIYTTGNQIIHSNAKNSLDPSGAGDNHGDRTIADALAAKLLDVVPVEKENNPNIPKNCYAARKAEQRRKEYEESLW